MIPGFFTLVLLSALVGYIGKDRKFGFWGNFACSFVFTPIIGILVVLASDKRPAPAVLETGIPVTTV